MGTTSKDLFKYPVYQYVNGKLIRIYPTSAEHDIWRWQVHHYIRKVQLKNDKELEKKQKLFLLPTLCHIDLHNHIRNFEQKWGIAPEKLLYGYRDKLTEY